jgi:hypothetical protein
MPVLRLVASMAAAMSFLAPAAAGAATLNLEIPSCSTLSLSGTSGSYVLSCAQQAMTCIAQAVPNNPQGGTTVNLAVSCNPAATSVSWQASRDCTTPVAGSMGQATVSETSGRSCVYTATASNGTQSGSAAAPVVWQGAGTSAPPTGCSITRTPSSGNLPAAGGAVSLAAACSGGGAVTSWQWRKNATTGWSAQQNPTDTLPANTGSAGVTYTYGLTACSGGSCAAEVVTTFTVAGSGPVGFCSNYQDVVIADANWPGTIDTPNNGGVRPDTVYVVRFTVPANATMPSGQPGLARAVEFMGSPANRIMSLSPSPCDFRGLQPYVIPSPDPTGANRPMAWSSDQTPNFGFALAGATGSMAKLTPGQTYYLNIRTIHGYNLLSSCTQSTCDMRISITAPQ